MRFRNPGKKPLTAALCLLGMLSMVFAAGTAVAEDTDVYQATVKNNALLLIDMSGSMNLPVYDHNIDYTAFLNWAEDPGATDPAQTDICVWQKWKNATASCYYNYYRVIPHRVVDTSSTTPPEDPEPGYPNLSRMLWEKDKIYLVSADDVGYREIVDENGRTTGMTGDYIWQGNDTSAYPYSAKVKYTLITNGVIDTGWTITDWDDPVNGNNIDVTVDEDGNRWVVYPSLPLTDPVQGYAVSWYNGVNLSGQRLKNYADIQITNTVSDPTTGVTRDMGFLGFLKAPGIVFSGLFRTNY